jgi:hypothetical protein
MIESRIGNGIYSSNDRGVIYQRRAVLIIESKLRKGNRKRGFLGN